MNLIDLKVIDFLNEVDSTSPAPGGGSVAALSTLLGISLIRMYGHLSIGKKKFLKLEEDIQNKFIKAFNKLDDLKNELLPLVQKDTEAFNLVMQAFKLPKETDNEKLQRKKAILNGTKESIKVPLQVAQISLKALEVSQDLRDYGNMNSITDFGVGLNSIYNGLIGAIYNVKINLPGLDSQQDIDNLLNTCRELEDKGLVIKENLINIVESKI